MFNREFLIRETIASIQRQEEENWECIVVDDGSQDRSRDVVQQFEKSDQRIKLYQRPLDQPKGPSTCRNQGFLHSKGEWVWFVDSDDHLAEGAVARILNADLDESIDLLVGMYEYMENDENSVGPKCWKFSPESAYIDHVTKRCPILPFMVIWRRRYLQSRERQLWHPKVLFHAAYEFHARILAERPSIKVINKVLYEYRLHDGSQSLSISKGQLDHEQMAEVRLGKLDSRLRVLEGLAEKAEKPAEKKARDQLKWRVLVQMKRDGRHVQTQKAIARFRTLLLQERSLRGLLGYFLVPAILRTGRGFRIIGTARSD